METLTIDFETYWSSSHSLTVMNPLEYCTHPDTELQSLAYQFNADKPHVLFGEGRIREWARGVRWENLLVLAHNMAEFDAMLLAWRLGVRPRMWGDTLAMARRRHAKTRVTMPDGQEKDGVSLAKLAVEFGLPAKGDLESVNTKGKRVSEFTAAEIDGMREYNARDVEICYALFRKLLPATPVKELRLIDLTIRMLTEPALVLNTDVLEAALTAERERKALQLLDVATMIGAYQPGMTDEQAAEAARKTLASAPKFAKLLRDLNVEVPMKPSPSGGEDIPALAKTDEAMIALTESDDPIVAAAAQARLGVKSTILESRVSAFLKSHQAHPERFAVPLRYCGADTTERWSGWAKMNLQNLPRVNPKQPKPTDVLRRSLEAPPGHKIVVVDLSAIELRVNHFLWKVPASMALIQENPVDADLYVSFAARLYGCDESEVTPAQRQVGKVAQLGLGFGSGPITFRRVAKIMGGVNLTPEESADIVSKWRMEYPEIKRGWQCAHEALPYIRSGQAGIPIDPWGMCKTAEGGIETPCGLISYPDLRLEGSEWFYAHGRNKARIYGPKMVENIAQHLARHIFADAVLKVKRVTGYAPALLVHDEWVGVVPEGAAADVMAEVKAAMAAPPDWWPELVTSGKGSIGVNYAEAK
jgi:DNA polymerase